MKTVAQIINEANPRRVAEAARAYDIDMGEEDDPSQFQDPHAFERFRQDLNRAVTIENTSQMTAVISRDKFEYEFMGETVIDGYISVDGVTPDPERKWALDFTAWGEWKAFTVSDRTGEELSVDTVALHLAQEIAFYGREEDMVDRRDNLLDAVEDISRNFDG